MAKPDAPQERRQERGGSQFVAVGVAILAVALFLGWLATRRPPETVAVTEPGDTTQTTQPVSGPATDVTSDDLGNTARVRELRGQMVRVTAPVMQALGRQIFWLEAASGQAFPVKLDSALVASGFTAPASGQYTVEGLLVEKPDALVDQWLADGILETADQAELAKFGTSYIEARRVTPARN